MRNATAIGDHPNIVEAVESQIDRIAEAHEKISTIEKYLK
jgi:4-aminobutyrate aminotransferase-like enzyme